MTNGENMAGAWIRHSSFGINSYIVIRHLFFRHAFPLIVLVLVVGIITVLSALVLRTVGYARKKGSLARAETEIAAMSAALENYKADNGIYPRDAATTDILDARTNTDPS